MGTLYPFPNRTIAEVSLSALIKNARVLRARCQKELIPVVKANAYGHGMIPVSKALVLRFDCQMLAVATLEEALELREHLNGVGILVLSGFLPHQLDAYDKYRLIPMIHSLQHLVSLSEKKTLPEVHLKFDTGMHRLGIRPEELNEAISVLTRLKIKVSGVASHFAESEDLKSLFIEQQTREFESMISALREKKLLKAAAKIHISNTGAILRKEGELATAVRPGLGLYGISPDLRLEAKELTPILQWRTRVLGIKALKKKEWVGYGRTYQASRDEKIAILPIGYADGYPRLLSNRGEVLIGPRRMAIRGRISMDLTTVDATPLTDISEGACVTLIGGVGKERISAWDLASWANTVPYEILCGISPRVPRIYLE